MTSLIQLVLWGLGGVGAGALSARWNWWRQTKPGIPILMYHKVGNPPPGSKIRKLWVSQKKFKNHMAYLADSGYTPILFKDLYQHWDHQKPLPGKPVLITFDDAYANNYTDAFPILNQFGYKATVFVVVQTVGWDNRWHDPKTETRIPMMSWADLKTLQNAGWEIGSHTMNHPRLPQLTDDERKFELERSRQVLGEFLEETPKTFAYPYGAGEDDEAVRKAVEAAGYRIAAGIHAGKWTADRMKESPFNLPRIFVRGDENLFDFHLQITRGRSRL